MEKEDLPPKTVKAQLVRLDDNLKQIERKQFAGIQRAPGSLPVLEAFQLFLENERKKAQRKLFIVTAIALFAILFSVVFASLYIRRNMRNVDARTDRLAYTTAELQQSLGTISDRQQLSEDRLVRTVQHLAAQRRNLSEQAERISQQQESLSTVREERDAEVILLREQVESLREAQESIEQMLASGTSRMPRNTMRSTASARDTRTENQRQTESEPTISYEVLTLTPEGRNAVRWMLPTWNAQE